MDKKEYIDRLVFCCARAPKSLTLNSDIRSEIYSSLTKAWLLDNRGRSKSNTTMQDAREFLGDLEIYMSGEYYGFKWPEDYSHIIQEGYIAIMHHEWIEFGGEFNCWDLEYRDGPDDVDKAKINKCLIELFPEEFDSEDYDCDTLWAYETLNEKHYAACQSIREEIIEKDICKIAKYVSFDYTDLIIKIPESVEHLIPHYIELIINLVAEKSPNTKLRVSFSLFDGETIAESCEVRWSYLGFTLKKIPDIDDLITDAD